LPHRFRSPCAITLIYLSSLRLCALENDLTKLPTVIVVEGVVGRRSVGLLTGSDCDFESELMVCSGGGVEMVAQSVAAEDCKVSECVCSGGGVAQSEGREAVVDLQPDELLLKDRIRL